MWPDYVKQVAYIAANISKLTVDYCYRISRYLEFFFTSNIAVGLNIS